VIGGEFRSRLLKSVPGLDTRPTPDRLRESLFNILAPRIDGTTFADLYAGTGAVGIEALSRGARRVVFVESNRAALAVIRENLRSLKAEGRADVRQGHVTSVAAMLEVDIAFIDPPYHKDHEYDAALSAVRAPFVIVQHAARLKLEKTYGSLKHSRTVRQGDNCLSFFETVNIEESGA
jgi:16S rRNA (guanine(966)-N(2))-methyltransferase RsmD